MLNEQYSKTVGFFHVKIDCDFCFKGGGKVLIKTNSDKYVNWTNILLKCMSTASVHCNPYIGKHPSARDNPLHAEGFPRKS